MASSLDKVKRRIDKATPYITHILALSIKATIDGILYAYENIKMRHVMYALVLVAVGLWAFLIGTMQPAVKAGGTVIPPEYREEECSQYDKDGDYKSCTIRMHKDSNIKIFIGKEDAR